MANTEYANAYSEVLEIIKYIPKEDYNKIPKSKIELFQKQASKEHKFEYNPLLTLEEQQVSKRAKAIIAILFRDYWATEIQREKIITKQRQDMNKLEQEKHEKYNPDNIFKKETNQEVLNNKPVIIKTNENIWKKIINKIRNIFYNR